MSHLEATLESLADRMGQPCHVQIGEDIARNCYLFDWRQRDEDFAMDMEDMFGDGSPEGFAMAEGDTLVPFALIGMSSASDQEGQPEGLLFVDLPSGQIVHIEVDGTALFDNPHVIAQSAATLAISAGKAPEED